MRTFNLRLTDEMYEQLKREAGADHRSMNAEILWLLNEALTAKERAS